MKLKKQSFTMIEIVFVIVIISILSSIAISKFYYSIDDANILKFKSQIALIRSAIIDQKEALILRANSADFIDRLDDAPINISNQKLFNNILNSALISTSSIDPKVGYWSKTDINSYIAWISKTKFVKFVYDNNTGRFDCNIKDKFCIQLTQ